MDFHNCPHRYGFILLNPIPDLIPVKASFIHFHYLGHSFLIWEYCWNNTLIQVIEIRYANYLLHEWCCFFGYIKKSQTYIFWLFLTFPILFLHFSTEPFEVQSTTSMETPGTEMNYYHNKRKIWSDFRPISRAIFGQESPFQCRRHMGKSFSMDSERRESVTEDTRTDADIQLF